VLTTVLTGAPTAAAAAKEPTAPTAGPAGALMSAATKGGLTEGWGRAAAVPAVPLAAATTPVTRSRVAEAVASTVAMATARSLRATPAAAEATTTTSMAGSVAMTKS
jgi:hypothetical protein